MAQEVVIRSRTLLPAATPDDIERKVWQIQYQVGELPPRFIFLPEKGYTKEKEAKAIQEDLRKRLKTPPPETITLGD
jgi:hypothetical protein